MEYEFNMIEALKFEYLPGQTSELYKKAIVVEGQAETTEEKISSIKKNDTWNKVSLLHGTQIIYRFWLVFSGKENSKRNMKKPRLVA